MRSFITILVFLSFSIQFCKAQDSTIVLSSSMLDKFSDQINLSKQNGWIFKQANNSGLTGIIDTIGWTHLKPEELSSRYADKNGRVEDEGTTFIIQLPIQSN